MTKVHQLTYGPFGENTYLISNDEGESIVIDPGMYHPEENIKFHKYLTAQNLKPIRMILTHAHLDHVFGVNWVHSTYDISPEVHADDKIVYDNAVAVATQYDLQMDPLVPAIVALEDGSNFNFGGETFRVLLAPGHSPGSVCFYNETKKYVISGDVVFQGSIGRTDLPGGDFNTLMNSIREKILSLPDDVIIYSGHGPLTTVGQERISNPFIIEHLT